MLKRCGKCKLDLSIEMFGKNKREKDGLHYCCRSCKKIDDKRHTFKHKEKIKLRKQEYYENNKEHIQNKTIIYQKSNPNKVKEYSKTARLNLKLGIFNHYCNNDIKCNHCEESELCLLTVDHINGGGNKHKKEIKSLYSWIKRNNYPEGFQILCWNCQLRKKNQEIKPKNPTFRQLQAAEYVRNIKHQVLEHYGKVCPCGKHDEIILTLDHVNNDGSEHRKLVGEGFNFYMWLRKNNYPIDPPLQVLCANCQVRKISKISMA